MALYNLAPASDEDVTADTLLNQFDAYIVAAVGQKMSRHGDFYITNPEVLDLEIDEIVQRVRIKLWQALRHKLITYPKAYINRIIQTELIDMIRRRKSTLPLLVDEEGELYVGRVMVTPQENMVDPAGEFEQEESIAALLLRVVGIVSSLPPCQKKAMIASLLEQVDDVRQLVQAFKKYHIVVDLPDVESNKPQVKASLSAARRKVEYYMRIEQLEHDVADKVPIAQRSKVSPTCRDKSLAVSYLQRGEVQEESIRDERMVEASIDKLSEPYQTTIRLYCVHKYTYHQIADELHLPIGTVKSHINRGMKKLGEILEQKNVDHALNGSNDIGCGTDITKIVAFVNNLDEPYRTAVELHYVKKYTCQQIADKLHLPKGTVKSHISRGMEKLRRSG